MEEKKKRLFYFEDSENAWIPIPDDTESLINIDNFDDSDVITLQFKCFLMTDEEFENLPTN
jgi:hypothetical protein